MGLYYTSGFAPMGPESLTVEPVVVEVTAVDMAAVEAVVMGLLVLDMVMVDNLTPIMINFTVLIVEGIDILVRLAGS